ncbi:MAG: DAK2 domain-containing protein [Clostridia bacterium]|nr:DAK2 domain-containing protein [Clostridia bacterium]
MERINGPAYRDMLQYGLCHLEAHRAAVNDLNVFPVPDGDTGTNMVMTVKNGLRSIEGQEGSLSKLSSGFAYAAVFGARGNSGVILSQFFRGLAAGFAGCEEADCAVLSRALDMGCEYAYQAVSKPVEGTILTVLRDVSDAVRENLPTLHSIDDAMTLMTAVAKVSLEHTPELLPILQKAGVVDSGGAGVVYFFDGIRKYLKGEPMTLSRESVSPQETLAVDYSLFDRNSDFSLGYCTELLIQLTVADDAFDYRAFLTRLNALGDSVVASREEDKIKVHIHTAAPETVMAFCHRFGEFLSMKVENMSVQHTGQTVKILCAPASEKSKVAVVAVAPNPKLQRMLSEMGADAVILSEEAPSSQDFIEAFDRISAENLLVFPNSSNSILSAMQAGSMYKRAKVTVLNCRSVPACYASLPLIDFDSTDIHATVGAVHDTIGHLREVSVAHAVKSVRYGDKSIVKNDYFALLGDEVLTVGDNFNEVTLRALRHMLAMAEWDVITLFYGKNRTEQETELLADAVRGLAKGAEVCVISTLDPVYDLVFTFE